jgi:hypothetical protein
MAKKRYAEDPENVKARRERFLALKPEVRSIYIEKRHHAAIKAFAKTLKTGENHDTN